MIPPGDQVKPLRHPPAVSYNASFRPRTRLQVRCSVAIPALLPVGLLPDGIHECTMEEILEQFGSFQDSDRRPRLAKALAKYLEELRNAEIGKYLIVDGSFV